MITRCPKCDARYDVEPDALLRVDGRALCFRCGSLFDALAEEPLAAEVQDGTPSRPILILNQRSLVSAERDATDGPVDLPFEVPGDLPTLEPATNDALDIAQALGEQKTSRGLWQGTIVLLLVVALLLQIGWQYRTALVQRFPVLEALCTRVDCRPPVVHAPDKFEILQRSIGPTLNEPGSLTLNIRVRNTATAAQSLPDMQLSLLDSRGSVMIRRRLSPSDYLFPSPPDDRRVAPGEVFTIELDFEDPGHSLTGFMIDFF